MSDNRRRIGTGREGNESLEGHASSSSQRAADTGTQIPEEESELGSAISRRPAVSGTHTKVGEKMGSFRFEVLVTPGNVKLNALLIPEEAALKCFTPADCQETYKKKIKITDPQNFDWPMTLRYNPSECFFILENKWQIFAIFNNVETLDKIRFYKPVLHSDDNHYLVETVKSRYLNTIHEFKIENFMFEHPLTDKDIQYQMLIICPEDVFKHFSEVGIPDGTRDIERLYFSDDLNARFWEISIVYHLGFYHLMLADFFTEYNLGKGDMISFYRPVHPLHSRHFLIAFVKGGGNLTQSEIVATDDTMDRGGDGQGDALGGGTDGGSNRDFNPTQSETAARDDMMDRGGDGQGDGLGEGTDRGGDGQGDGVGEGTDRGSNRHGDGRGRSHSGGRKWWKLGFGCCCFPTKSNART